MKNMLLIFRFKLQDLANQDDGQDLVEYALIVALIAFGATLGMNSLASGINSAFNQASTTLGNYVS